MTLKVETEVSIAGVGLRVAQSAQGPPPRIALLGRRILRSDHRSARPTTSRHSSLESGCRLVVLFMLTYSALGSSLCSAMTESLVRH